MIERVCQSCGKTYQTFPSIRKKYCSQSCAGAAKMNNFLMSCLQCNKPITRTPSQLKRSPKQFCSKTCATIHRNLSDQNPAYKRDVSGDKNPMFGKGFVGIDNPMFGKTGENCPRWNGGVKVRKDGYVMRYCQSHPSKNNKKGYVLEHRLVVERYLGRFLTDEEVVHHINQNPSDNRIENLQVMTQSEHAALHSELSRC